MIKKKIVIKGRRVKNVGYRPFLFEIATRKLISHFDAVNKKEVDNDGYENVDVFVGGPEDDVDNFIEFIKDKDNMPEDADVKYIEVVEEDYKGGIMTTESFSMWLNSNQLSKFITIGTKIATGQDKLRTETNDNFGKMDLKYDAISKAMFATVDAIEKRNQILEKRMDKIDGHVELIERNIESLLKILVEKK